MNERGQTAYDYLLGVVLLLVAITAVLTLLPQLFGPFVDPVSTDQQKMADRISAELIETNSTVRSERTLDVTTIDDGYIDQLKTDAGVPSVRNVNITIQNGPGNVVERGGDLRFGADPAGTTVRQVRLVQRPPCENGCQLIVRVW